MGTGRVEAIAARIERLRRRKKEGREEDEGMLHPPYFKDESIWSLDHLKAGLRHGNPEAGVPSAGGTLHPYPTESEYRPLYERIRDEPWEQRIVAFVRELLPLLDPSLPRADVEATVFIFGLCSLCSIVSV